MKKKILERRRKLFSIVAFLINFNLLSVPLYVLSLTDFSLLPIQNFIATATARTLRSFGYSVTSKDYVLTLTTTNEIAKVEISTDCLGWKSMYALAALALAITYPLKKKIKFLLVGLPALFFINFLRIVSTLVFCLTYGFSYLETVHTLLWREGLILLVVCMWYLWIKREKYNIEQMKLFFR